MNINFKNNHYKQLIISNLKNKYPYLITGILVIFFLSISIMRLSFVKKITSPSRTIKIEQKTAKTEIKQEVKTYIVKKGDHLWKIAEVSYGSGYNAYDIAKANNITNPSLIYSGQKLVIPSVEPKQITKGEITQAQTSQVVKKIDKYTVQSGDHLWKIAVEVYGDGMNWVRIAKANNIENPNLIFKGQVLKIE